MKIEMKTITIKLTPEEHMNLKLITVNENFTIQDFVSYLINQQIAVRKMGVIK